VGFDRRFQLATNYNTSRALEQFQRQNSLSDISKYYLSLDRPKSLETD
jgi:hypothetical protein